MGALLFFSSRNYPLFAQDQDGQEAPEFLMDMNIGDLGTDIYWQGYWRYSIVAGTSWETGEDGFVFPSSFSGLQQGVEFSQEPDFFLSLILMDHYFLETSFTEGYDKNTYVMGYTGGEDSPVKEIRIGNAGIGISEYQGIDVSSPDYNTPGISGFFQTAQSEHEFMIRYDPTDEQAKYFIGEYEVTEEEIPLTSYLEGQYFILPDREITSLRVYLEEEGGSSAGSDGRRYALVTSGYTVDLDEGLLSLEEEPAGNVAVYYTSGGSGVGETSGADEFIMDTDNRFRPDPDQDLLPFSWPASDPYTPDSLSFENTRGVTINGELALLIHSPGTYSPFQFYNRYEYNTSLPDESWRTDVSLLDKGTEEEEVTEYTFSADSYILTVRSDDYAVRDPHNRVPFSAGNPELYGPGRLTDESKVSRQIVMAVKEDTDGYYLGTGIVKGSVTVKVDGVEDQTVEVDYDTGELTFSRYIFPDDRITVTYRTEQTGFGGGDLFMAQGNRLFLSPFMKLELAESLRWTIPESMVTEEEGESPGEIDLAANWFYEKDNLNLSVSAGLSLQTPDTAGNLRIHSMEDSGYTFSLSEDQLVPSEEDLSPADSSYAPEDRKDLIYRDFISTNNTGQTYLNSYLWDAPEDTDEQGPSLAAARESDPFSSRVMVMTYDIEGAGWSAGDYLPVSEELIDLSGYSEFSFYLLRQNLEEDDLKLNLLLGENGESDDYDENGTTDQGNSRYLVELSDIALPAVEDTWSKVTVSLTPRERLKLSRVRSFRFILKNSTAGSSRGELLAAGFRGEGSPLVMRVLNSSGTEQDGENLEAAEIDDSTLELEFPEVASTFHPEDEDQKILEINWGSAVSGQSNLATGEYWTGTSWMEGIDPSAYGELVFYLKHGQTGGEGFINLTDPEGQGIHLSYEPKSMAWEKLTVNLREGTAEFSGSSSIKSLGFDRDVSEITRFEIGMTGLTGGTLYIDEVHFSDPIFSTAANASYTLDYSLPGNLITTAGGFPLLGNFNLYNRINYTTEDRDSLFSSRVNQVESQLSTGADVIHTRLEGDFDLEHSSDATSYNLGHLIRIPASSPYGWVSDSYSRSFQEEDDVMARENCIHLTPHPALTLDAGSASEGSDGEILQEWTGEISSRPAEEVTLNLDLSLYQTAEWESDSKNYASDWVADFTYLSPLKEGIENRQGFGNASFTFRKGIFGLQWSPSVSYTAEVDYQWEQTNNWTSELSFPLELPSSRGEWTLEPGYSRELENVLYPDQYEGFRDDWVTLGEGLESQFPLWHFIPFYEIFSSAPLKPFEKTLTLTEESSYTPSVFLSLSRMPGSRLSDLIVPASMDITMDREYVKDQDTLYWENNWEFQYIQSALNLFGSYGSRPVFDFYQTDEWTSSVQFILSSREKATPTPEELSYQNYINLLKGDRWEISLNNRLAFQFDDRASQEELQFCFRWREEENAWLRVPLFDRLIVKPNYREHEEILEYSGDFDQEDPDENSYSAILTHQTSLIIQGLGSVKGWLSLGLAGKEEVFQNAYELGVELEITF